MAPSMPPVEEPHRTSSNRPHVPGEPLPGDVPVEEIQAMLREAAAKEEMNVRGRETGCSSPGPAGAVKTLDPSKTGERPKPPDAPARSGHLEKGSSREPERGLGSELHMELHGGSEKEFRREPGGEFRNVPEEEFKSEFETGRLEGSMEGPEKKIDGEARSEARKIAGSIFGMLRRETRHNEIFILKAMVCGGVLLFVMWNIPFMPHSMALMISGGAAGFVARNEISAALAALLPVFLFQSGYIVYSHVMTQPGRELLQPLSAINENPHTGAAVSGMIGTEVPLFLLYFAMTLVGGMLASTFKSIIKSSYREAVERKKRC